MNPNWVDYCLWALGALALLMVLVGTIGRLATL